MFGWHVPSPNQALLISGKKNKSDAPFRVVSGHGVFVLPIRNRISYMDLSMQESEVTEDCVTQQGITLLCKAVIAFKVADDAISITNAARRFLDDQRSMPILTGRIFAGHLRSIVGSMSVEDIIRERQKLADEVLDASKPEMEKLGLIVDSFQIQSIDDKNSGYIDALAAPQKAAVQQNAKIAQAAAAQAAAQAEQESQRNQAEYMRQTQVAQAGYKAEVDKAQSEAAQAGPLAQAQAQQAVIDEQTRLAQKQAELKEQELQATVKKPADAEAYRIATLAEANAKQTKLQAEAMAAGQGVTIQRALVDQMPTIIGAAAQQLSHANITVLNGSDGLSEIVSGLASQAGTLLSMVRKSLAADEVAVPAAGAQLEQGQRQPARQ